MNDIDRIALPPGVQDQTENTGEVETEAPQSSPRFTLDGKPVAAMPPGEKPPVSVEDSPVLDALKDIKNGQEEAAASLEYLAANQSTEPIPVADKQVLQAVQEVKDIQQAQAPAQPQVIVPPVNVTVPPELVALFNSQLRASAQGIVNDVTTKIEGSLQDVLDSIPAQEAQAVKTYPWLVPAFDLMLGVCAIALIVFVTVAAIGFNNPLAKQWIGAAGMIVLALFKRSPTTPPATTTVVTPAKN